MIKYVVGDATDPVGDGLKLIVHCVNDKGKWGWGFVRALSAKWPQPENEYRYSDRPKLKLGEVAYVGVEPDITVANLVGQHDTANSDEPHPVRYDAIFQGMLEVGNYARQWNATIHMPRMGSGLAGGSWEVVAAIINETCYDLSVTVYDLPEEA